MLNAYLLHYIVGGLKPGALPHEEAVWCRVLQASHEAPTVMSHVEQQDVTHLPTRHEQEDASR